MDDYVYLLRAYELGGAVEVKCAASRASLKSVGFMEDVHNLRIYGKQKPHAMRLTKDGRKRAEEIFSQRRESLPPYRKHRLNRLNRLDNINLSLTKQQATRYIGTSYQRIPKN